MNLDKLIERLTQLRKEYPQLAKEVMSMVVRDHGEQRTAIVGAVNIYKRDGVPTCIVIEDYVPEWRK